MSKIYCKPTSTRVDFVAEEMLAASLTVNAEEKGDEMGSNRHNGWNSDAWTGGFDEDEE